LVAFISTNLASNITNRNTSGPCLVPRKVAKEAHPGLIKKSTGRQPMGCARLPEKSAKEASSGFCREWKADNQEKR